MITEQQIFVMEKIVQDLKHASRTPASDWGVDLRLLHDEIRRVLMVLETEERDIRMQQVKVLRQLELVSTLREQLYNGLKVVQSENRRDSQ